MRVMCPACGWKGLRRVREEADPYGVCPRWCPVVGWEPGQPVVWAALKKFTTLRHYATRTV